MSILIKGMEMPREDGAIIVYKIGGKFFAQRGRADKLCLLIEIHEPHGRLIDADALKESIKEARKAQPEIADVYDDDYFLVAEWLASAPTIIPAEEAKA